MKSKEYIILGVVIVLLGAYLFLRNSNRSQYELPALAEIAGADISRIDISTAGGTVDLVRSGDQWHIGKKKYPADISKVQKMLSVLGKLKLTALISETGAYSHYDLTDEKKIGVKAWAGDRLIRDFSIGKPADTYQHTFVRLADNTNVYQAADNFRQTFDQTTEGLRDKTALSFTASDITEIELVSNEKHITLSMIDQPAETTSSQEASETETDSESSKHAWVKAGGAAADAEAVQRLLSQLAYLNCTSYLETKQKADFSAPTSSITLKGKETYSLSLYEKGASETGCPAVSSQNDYPFTLSETAYSRLTETLGKLLGTETGT